MEMSNLCEEDSPTYQKWKEVLDLDLQVSFSAETYIPSSLCDEALGMVEALCGVDLEERDRIREEQASRPRFQENETQEWTKGLTLEQTYLFKGGDTPEEGLVLQVYSNGQASLMGSPHAGDHHTGKHHLGARPRGLLLAWARLYCSLMSRKELSRSWSTARWKIKAPIPPGSAKGSWIRPMR